MARKSEGDKAVSVDQMMENGYIKIGTHVAVVTAGPVYHGKLVGVNPSYYILEDAAWVVETGRIHQFVKDPSCCTEAEYIGVVFVERDGGVFGVYPTPAYVVTTR
jgi:hypothetical protein